MANLEALHREIVSKLQAEYQFKHAGDYLQQGVCPECGKKELFTKYAKPYYITCNRRSKCMFETTIKHLMPELFENLNEKFPPTQEDPNATAKAYLTNRGLDYERMAGWFEQGHFWRNNGNKSTATVKFFLTEDRTVFWERLIESVETKQADGSTETHNHNFSSGKRAGLWWMPPNQTIEKGDTVYLCEGILKAIPLALIGKKVVSIMASGSFPKLSIEPYLKLGVRWVWALDSDEAGRKATHTHHQRLLEMGEKSTAIFATEYPKKLDWDELHPENLSKESFRRYAYYGNLELCENHQTKAFLMWNHRNEKNENHDDDCNYFCFDFDKNGYSVTAKRKEYDKLLGELLAMNPTGEDDNKLNAFISTAEIKRISTFSTQFLYFQKFDNTEDGEYVFKLRMANGSPDQIVGFAHLSKSDSFKEKCQRLVAGANFMGTNTDLSWLYNRWMQYKPPSVGILSYIGYSKDHDAYIFNKIAVQGKKIIPINNEDFFQLKKHGVKTSISTQFEIDKKINLDWFADYKTAFGYKGLVALTWWTSTFLVQQIKAQHKDFPYLTVIGTAASGKTAMVNFLWKITGLDGSKMPINPNLATKASFYRHVAVFSNIPVQFNEMNNEQSLESMRGKHQAKFDLNEIKGWYDGEPLRQTANKSHSNNINVPTFKSNLLITQNVDLTDISEAIITRFCNIPFNRDHHTPQGKLAADRLLQLDVKDCSGYLLHVVTKAKELLIEYEKQLPRAMAKMQQFHSEIGHQRIKDTHGKILAMAYCLPMLLPLTEFDIVDIENQIILMAIERQNIINGDHPLIVRFWELFDDLDTEVVSGMSMEGRINHSNNLGQVAVHLPTFTKKCLEKYGIPSVLDVEELRRLLPTSKQHPMLDYKNVWSAIERTDDGKGKTMKCYIFKREK